MTATNESWFDGYEWLDGLAITPHASINKHLFALEYQGNPEGWQQAFAFMKGNDLAGLAPGKYDLDHDNVFAFVTDAPGKDFEISFWESHRRYNDIHYVISGEEKIGIAPFSAASIVDSYDEAKDLITYNAKGEYFIANPGIFFIMLPEDVHRPGIKTEQDLPIKKIVFKIKTAR